jgi:L-malate glycosyltransferase
MRSPHKPARVFHLIDTLRPGGAEQLVLTTIRHLDRARFEPMVGVLGPPLELQRDIEAAGVPVTVFDVGGPADWMRGIWRLARFMRHQQVDIVHTHLRWSNVLGRLAALLSRTPRVVTTLHHLDYKYWPAVSIPARLWKALDLLTATTINDALLAVSEAVRRDYAGRLPFREVSRLYNYLDLQAFQEPGETRAAARDQLGWAERDFILLTIARLAPEKGHAYLVRAMAAILRTIPHARLVLVGDGPQEAPLKALAHDLGIAHRVSALGSRRDIARLLAASDLFVFPSTGEAFGIAVIEAMAAGLPVITTRVDGLDEVVRHGQDGLLVPPADAGALTAAVVQLFEDARLRAALAREARATVARRFSVNVMLPQLEDLYWSLLHGGRLEVAKASV